MSVNRIQSGVVLIGLVCLAAIADSQGADSGTPRNRHAPYPPVVNITEGVAWPHGQILPTFATPASTLDAIEVQALSKDEQITFSTLQGLVNKKQPRIYLLDAQAGEGMDTWADTATVNFESANSFGHETRYDLLAKYAREVSGVVLYDPAKSSHYRNLAGTVAALRGALPVTAEVFGQLKQHGIALKVLVDLTDLNFSTPLEIYGHLYESYWKDCVKRLIVSARPDGDFHHTRDIGAACGAAVVWLDNRVPAEKKLMRKFFGDMKAGDAIVLGWYSTERSGITTASEFGIGTLPADFFMSGSVFSGTDHRIRIPAVPKMPALENKVYVAIFISDGDNIQYTQHAMRSIWDRTASSRGGIPLNWTISPGLVDIGPGIMNYYYSTATPRDCFVTGPSGLGYMMPSNTLNEPGAPVGEHTTDQARMEGYARLTETYLQRSGLRVMTIWDNASAMQRDSYERICRSLYGATVQNFKDVPSVEGGVAGGRVRFDKLVVPYAGSYEHINSSLTREIKRWDGKSPLFLSSQVDIWGEMKPDRIMDLQRDLNGRFPDKVEFVRADHYFNLYNQANSLPFNLAMSPKTSVRSGDAASHPELTADGTPVTLWSSSQIETAWLGFDFGGSFKISRYVIRHAGANGMDRKLNTRDYTVAASADGKVWKNIDAFKGNTDNVTDVGFRPVTARYVKITVYDAGADGIARIADVEVFGSR